MKRKVRKPNGPKEPSKVATSARREIQALARSAMKQVHKERAKLRAERKLSTLATLLSFGLEQDHVLSKINRREREAGLTESAPLPVADAVGGEHPGAVVFSPSKLTQLVRDLAVLLESDGRLLFRMATRQTELEARVALAEAALERLVHDEAERLKFIHGGAACPPADFPPGQEVSAKLAAYLARHSAPTDAQEIGHGAPLDQDAGVGQGAVGVPLVEEAGNPDNETLHAFIQGYYLPGLQAMCPVPQPSRLSRFVRKCVAQVRRLLDAYARRITGFEPPV